MNFRRIALCALLGCGLAQAQPQPQGQYVWEEFGKRIGRSQAVAALGPTLMGEQVSLSNGALSFETTDVSLPGNDALPVAFTRRYEVFNRKDHPVTDGMLADWQVVAPNINAVFAPNWTAGPHGTLGRCSSGAEPPSPPLPYTLNDFWQGLRIELPGGGGELLRTHAGVTRPADGYTYAWVAGEQIHLHCQTTIQNGTGAGTGEGFWAVTPDGTRYRFDWLAQTQEPVSVSRNVDGFDTPVTHLLTRKKNTLYATRVEDRFGNAVEYTYTNAWNQPGRLTRIRASDGRELSIAYSGNYVASVSDGVRTWHYHYASTALSRDTLSQVRLPDQSTWEVEFAAFTNAQIRYPPPLSQSRTCYQNEVPENVAMQATGTLTHPSGAKGAFTVGIVEHGRASVPISCTNVTTPGNDPGDDLNLWATSAFSLTLLDKTLSGPGLVPATWSYSYQPNISHVFVGGATAGFPVCQIAHCDAPPCTQASCASASVTTVTGPQDEKTHYHYGNTYRYNEGKLLRVEHYGPDSLPGAPLSTTTHTYDLTQSGTPAPPYPRTWGSSLRLEGEGWASMYHRPLLGSQTSRQGVTFSTTHQAFNAFAQVLTVKRENSQGHHRTETFTYENTLAAWVLGQVGTTRCVSSSQPGCSNQVTAETTYDPITARPLTYSAHGQLIQTLTWNTTATVASGQRGTLHTVTDGNHHVTTLTDWKRGIPQTIQHPPTPESPAGAIQSAVVNDRGEITSITDELGHATSYGYDPMGRINLVTYPTGDSTAWTPTTRHFVPLTGTEPGLPPGGWHSHWRLTETTGAHSKETYFDSLWRPILTRERDTTDSATTRYVRRTFDAEGRETFASYPSDVSHPTTGIWTDYDALGRVKTVLQSSELGLLKTETEYLPGFQTRTTTPRNQQTTVSYLAFDAPDYSTPINLQEPGGVTTAISRDVFGKPITIIRSGTYTPPGGNPESLSLTRRFLYDAQQRLCKTIEPDAGIALFAYDPAGNLHWSATGQNTLTSTTACQTSSVPAAERSIHHHDARHRLIAIDHPAPTDDVGFTHYADGALHTASTGTLTNTAPVTWSSKTSEWTYAYNKRRLVTDESLYLPPENRTFTLTRSYTALGHDATLTYPDSFPGTALSIAYAPNALGQQKQAGSYATAASYHPNGSIAGFTYGNAITRSLTQNERGLPNRILDQYAGTKTLDHTLTYDEHANLQSITDGTPGAQESRTLTYDARDRLTHITATPATGSYTETYAYDPLDRMRRVVQPGKDWRYHYDPATFRLNDIRNPSSALQRSYQWNARGEWTTRTTHTLGNPPITPPAIFHNGFEDALISTPEAFLFDRAGRLTGVNGLTHRYDAHGRRVLTVEPLWGSRYQVYDLKGTLRYIEGTGNNNERIDYIHLGGQLIAERSRPLADTTQIPRYLHSDHRGSPSVKTASNRTVIYRSWHDAYGAPKDGLWREGPGFTGHQMDAIGQLVYMQQRYHDPETGFISTDPVHVNQANGSNFNRYWYANNNPYKYRDPDGRYIESAWDAASLSIGIVSLAGNVWDGNWSAAAADVGGVALDTAALLIPVVPGGASVAIQASRAGERLADSALVVRGGTATGANSAQGIAAGTSTRADNGITGFSAESANGASLCDLCTNIPNNQVGVTTAGQIRAAGGEVTATPGRSPNHATVSGLPPQTASDLLTPAQPNPVPKPERTQWD